MAATAGWEHTLKNNNNLHFTKAFLASQRLSFVLLILAGKHSAQWALDDVLIGMNDSSRTGFHDKFDGSTPLRHNWYRIQGGEVTVDCLSLDTALTFNSEAIDSESQTLTGGGSLVCCNGGCGSGV